MGIQIKQTNKHFHLVIPLGSYVSLLILGGKQSVVTWSTCFSLVSNTPERLIQRKKKKHLNSLF